MVGKYWSRILWVVLSLCEWVRGSARVRKISGVENKRRGARPEQQISDIKVPGGGVLEAGSRQQFRTRSLDRPAESKLVYQGRKKERDERSRERSRG